jgi:hypothetical protein
MVWAHGGNHGLWLGKRQGSSSMLEVNRNAIRNTLVQFETRGEGAARFACILMMSV